MGLSHRCRRIVIPSVYHNIYMGVNEVERTRRECTERKGVQNGSLFQTSQEDSHDFIRRQNNCLVLSTADVGIVGVKANEVVRSSQVVDEVPVRRASDDDPNLSVEHGNYLAKAIRRDRP